MFPVSALSLFCTTRHQCKFCFEFFCENDLLYNTNCGSTCTMVACNACWKLFADNFNSQCFGCCSHFDFKTLNFQQTIDKKSSALCKHCLENIRMSDFKLHMYKCCSDVGDNKQLVLWKHLCVMSQKQKSNMILLDTTVAKAVLAHPQFLFSPFVDDSVFIMLRQTSAENVRALLMYYKDKALPKHFAVTLYKSQEDEIAAQLCFE